MKPKTRIQDPQDPRSPGSQDRKKTLKIQDPQDFMTAKNFKDPRSVGSHNRMNVQGTRSTGSHNKMPRASSTGSDRKNDKIQDENFMESST